MSDLIPCTFSVTTYVPKDAWIAPMVDHRFSVMKVIETNQFELLQYMNRLFKQGFVETKQIAQDKTVMSIFYSKDLGWKVITSDIKA